MSRADEETAERPQHVREPEKGTRLSALEIHDNALAGGTEDAERPSSSLLWSSLGSGIFIGFSFLACAFVSTLATTEPMKKALMAAAYPLGFIFVVLGRSELFTENTLTPVLPLLHERSMKRLQQLGRLWTLLLVGNIVGALFFGVLVATTHAVPAWMAEPLRTVAETGTSGGFASVLYRGVYGGALIALMSWLLNATNARGAQIVIIWLCAASISAFEFRHSIAGSVEAFFRIFAGTASAGEMVGGFIVPAIIGNAVGGVVFVTLLHYAQVYAQLPKKPDAPHTS
jgi:formate/nitrite transporter FocA (FNT family)